MLSTKNRKKFLVTVEMEFDNEHYKTKEELKKAVKNELENNYPSVEGYINKITVEEIDNPFIKFINKNSDLWYRGKHI